MLSACSNRAHHLLVFRALDRCIQHIGSDHDWHQSVVDIVCNPAGEQADTFSPLHAKELRLQTFLLSDVGVDYEKTDSGTVLALHEAPTALHDEVRASA